VLSSPARAARRRATIVKLDDHPRSGVAQW
jgi:hypothetical protein